MSIGEEEQSEEASVAAGEPPCDNGYPWHRPEEQKAASGWANGHDEAVSAYPWAQREAAQGEVESMAAPDAAEPDGETPTDETPAITASAPTASTAIGEASARFAAQPPMPEIHAGDTPEQADQALDPKTIMLTRSAYDCVEKAKEIAKLLNNPHVRVPHLILAMTLDEGISRKMQRDLDVGRARQVMLRKLGEIEWRYNGIPGGAPEIGRDLADVLAAAAAEAGERNQEVSLFDLLRGFERGGSGADMLKEESREARDTALIVAQMERLEGRLQEIVVQAIESGESRLNASLAVLLESQLHRLLPELARQIALRIEPPSPPRLSESSYEPDYESSPVPTPPKAQSGFARTLGSLFS